MADNPVEMLLNAITSTLQNECKSFLAGPLATRLASVETDARFQYDPVARNIAAQITKVADQNPDQVVTADQISSFYKQIESLYPETEFKTAFADLFPGSVLETPGTETLEVPREVEQARHEYYADDRLPGQSEVVVEENQEFSPYTAPEFEIGATFAPHLHKFAETAIQQELAQFGAGNVRIQHKTNGPDLMVYLAQFTSPTGRHQVVVPVQVQDDLVVLPEVFGEDDRMYDFTTAGFAAYERDNIRLAEVQAADAMDHLRHAESVDAPRNPTALENFINEDEVVESNDLDDLVEGDSTGLEDVESSLQNAIMRKQSSASGRTISTAAEIVTRQLRKLGQHKTPVFAGDGDHGDLLFTAHLTHNNRIAQVVIPVETQGETVLFPTHFVNEKEAYQLDENGVQAIFQAHPEQTAYDISTSNLAEATYNTLRQTVYAATMRSEHDKAQEALEVIANKFGNEAHVSAMKDYQDWIVKAQHSPVENPNIEVDFGHKMSADDWASALQREISAVTDGKGVTVAEELGTFEFEKYDDPGFEGSIITNKIDGIDLT